MTLRLQDRSRALGDPSGQLKYMSNNEHDRDVKVKIAR